MVALISSIEAFGQIKETVRIIKNNNDTINFTTTLRVYKRQYIFPDDEKGFIKGRLNGKNTKLPKSDIREIILQDGSIYQVLNNNNIVYYIGFFVSKGSKDFFKAYTYQRSSVNSGFGGPGVPVAQTTANKLATVSYYTVEKNIVRVFNGKKGFQKLSEECQEFKTYFDQQKRIIKDEEVEQAFRYYNENCN